MLQDDMNYSSLLLVIYVNITVNLPICLWKVHFVELCLTVVDLYVVFFSGSSSFSVTRCWKDERIVGQRAVRPFLLPTLPESDCSKIGLPTPRAHLHFTAWTGLTPDHNLKPECHGPAFSARSERRRREWQGWRGQVEAPSVRASWVPILPKRAGQDRSLPDTL